MAARYLSPQPGQLNHPHDKYQPGVGKQNPGSDGITSLNNEFSGSLAKKSGSSALDSESLNPSVYKSDTSHIIQLADLNPGSIIQGVIFSEIIGRPRCFRRRI